MRRLISLDELRDRLSLAQQRLTHEKIDILALYPLHQTMSREAYVFAYRRAEHIGMQAVKGRLAGLTWLPMRLDPKTEMEGSGRKARNAWLVGDGGSFPPSSVDFGNDFMHVITRTALRFGWDSRHVVGIVARVAQLFYDLSLLVGVAFYCAQMAEMQVDSLTLTAPDNLDTTAAELAAMIPVADNYRRQTPPSLPSTPPVANQTRRSSSLRLPPYISVIEGGQSTSPDARV